MLQRLIAAVLAVLGVAAIALGVASATVWRADDPLVATAAPGGDARTLVTDPGVLEVAGEPVTITVRAEGAPVVLAVGRDTDVTGWVGTDPYERVTGLADWHTLTTTAGEPVPGASPTTDPAAAAEPSPSASAAEEGAAVQAADPTGSDMWVVQVTGDGSATLEWPAQDGRWSLLAVSLGDAAPVLDLSWPQTVTTPWLWPGVAFGVLLLAVAAVLLVRVLRERREGPDAGWHPVTTGQIAVVAPADAPAPGTSAMPTGAIPVTTISATGAPLTRRQIREAEAAAAAAAAAARRRGRRTPTGAVPVVTGAVPAVTGAVPAVSGDTRADAERPAGGASGEGPTATPAGTPPPGTVRPDGSSTPANDAGARPRATEAAGAASTTSARPAPVPPGGPAGPSRPVAPSGPEAPGTSSGPAAPATPSTQATPSTPGTPVPAKPGPATSAATTPPPATADEAGPERPRGLASRLPWRRDRAEAPAPAAGTTGSGPSAPATPSPATAWSPTPGVPATPPAPSRAATPGFPAAPRPGEPDEDPASQAGRADAWRRMWGFPEERGTAPDDQQQGTEEDR